MCVDSPLREFHDRYICDNCNGMLLRDDDLADAVAEIDGSRSGLAFGAERGAGKPCPICTRELVACSATVCGLPMSEPVLRCERDGMWVSQAMLAAVFAKASRRVRTLHVDRAPYSPGLAFGPRGSVGAAMESVRDAFGAGTPATAGLAISHWGRMRPRVHTIFVSAYKDRRLGCPSCKEVALAYAGDRWMCNTCSGSFVENAALTAMIVDMTQNPWELPGVEGARGDRACPVCEQAMNVEVLEAVTIDRCAAHGVWFDDKELETALHHAMVGEPKSIGGWVRRLFHRHGKIE